MIAACTKIDEVQQAYVLRRVLLDDAYDCFDGVRKQLTNSVHAAIGVRHAERTTRRPTL